MNLRLAIAFLFVCISLPLLQGANPVSDFKVAFDYDVLDVIKVDLLKPFIPDIVEQFVPTAWSYSNNKSLKAERVEINLTAIEYQTISVDWNNSHILVPGNKDESNVLLMDFVLNLTCNYSIEAGYTKEKGRGGFLLQGFDLNITLGQKRLNNGTIEAYIPSAKVKIQKARIIFHNQILNDIASAIALILGKPIDALIELAIERILTHQVSDKLAYITGNNMSKIVNGTTNFTVTFSDLTCIIARLILMRRSPASVLITSSHGTSMHKKLWCCGRMSNGPVSLTADTL